MCDEEFKHLRVFAALMAVEGGLNSKQPCTVIVLASAVAKGWDQFSKFLPLSEEKKLHIKNELVYVATISGA